MIQQMGEDSFCRFLGLEFVEFEEDRIKGRIPFKPELKNPYGTTHGGVLYAFADIVAGVLACSLGKACTTANGSLNYLAPAGNTEYLYCEAKILKAGLNLVVLRVEITTDSGMLVDEGSFTLFKSRYDIVSE